MISFDGTAIRERLARLQNPVLEKQEDKRLFDKINVFLRNVTGHSDAELDIPRDGDRILVRVDNKVLPLMRLGTGIHQVVILAAAGTVLQDHILCIEEPELHLHPILQKKLIYYLERETSNQYFITTHSAHILDLPNVSAFHVQHDGTVSTITPITHPNGRSEVCADLGYRASDIVQTNCVIWVEGPSDRIYLRHWIARIDPTLIESVHYSLMFYGGRLLSHLTAEDADDTGEDDFIELLRLNRYSVILMDSDRRKKRAHINKTKKRVERELSDSNGFAWVTQGREIENYVHPELMEKAVKSVYPNATELIDTDPYAHCYFYKIGKKVVERVDKMRIAQAVIELDDGELQNVLDLQRRMGELVAFIHSANDAFELSLLQ